MEKGKAVMGMGRRWAVDFTDNSTSPSSRDIPDPPGFTRASQDQDDSTVSREKKNAESNWKAQKAWEVAQAPFKNLMMMGFMMWMAGSTVHLFSIGITFSALWQPISALQGVGKVFEPYKDSKVDLLGPKLLFIALNLAGLGLGIWKLNTLGLLPTHPSDWVSSLPPPQEVEYSGGDSSIVLGFIYETLLKDYKLYLHQEGYNFDQTTKSKQQFSNVSLCLPRRLSILVGVCLYIKTLPDKLQVRDLVVRAEFAALLK
nr:ER membrane protein complex subunit 4 [Ipomoea trifida]